MAGQKHMPHHNAGSGPCCAAKNIVIEVPKSEGAKVFAHKACVLHSTILAIEAMQNAVPLLHGPLHCTYHYKVFMEMFLGYKTRVLCSGMDETDVIYGAPDKLARSISDAYEVFRPELIGVITTCASDISAEPVEEIVKREAKKLTGCEAVHIPSGGFRGGEAGPNQGYGYHLAYNALVPLMEPPKRKLKNSINILGHTHPRGPHQDIDELLRIIRRLGIKVNCVLTAGARVSDIRRFAEAELNVLRCENNARRTAELLQQRFGMPYTNLGMSPVGIGAVSDWLGEIIEFFGMQDQARKIIDEEERWARSRIEPMRQFLKGKKAAVFLSPGKTLAVSRFLYEDLGMKPVVICLLHYNKWCVDRLRQIIATMDFEPKVMVEPEYHEVVASLVDYGVEVGLGGTPEKQMCKNLRIPYVHEMVYEEPHKGYRGAVKLAGEICEAIKSNQKQEAGRTLAAS